MEDLSFLSYLLIGKYDEWAARTAAGEEVSPHELWDEDMDCVRKHFKCAHGMDVIPYMLSIGMYPPGTKPSSVPSLCLDELPPPSEETWPADCPDEFVGTMLVESWHWGTYVIGNQDDGVNMGGTATLSIILDDVVTVIYQGPCSQMNEGIAIAHSGVGVLGGYTLTVLRDGCTRAVPVDVYPGAFPPDCEDTGGEEFPPYNMVLTGDDNTYTFELADPMDPVGGKLVYVQAYSGNWGTLFTMNEADLNGFSFTFGTLPFTDVRVVYLYDNDQCQVIVPVEQIIPEPGECGTLSHGVDLVADEMAGTFTLEVTLSDVQGYLTGPFRVGVNGEPSTLTPSQTGLTVLGPFLADSTVVVTLTNLNSSACDILLGTFGPSACYPDEPVASVRDAGYMGSADPGVLYFIGSDTGGAGNDWASNVGSFVLGGVYSPASAGDLVRFGSGSSMLMIWDGTELVPLFPQMHGVYSASVFTFVSQQPSAHGFFGRWAKVELRAGPVWITAYDGPESALSSVLAYPYDSGSQVVSVIKVTYTWGGCSATVSGDDIAPESFSHDVGDSYDNSHG